VWESHPEEDEEDTEDEEGWPSTAALRQPFTAFEEVWSAWMTLFYWQSSLLGVVYRCLLRRQRLPRSSDKPCCRPLLRHHWLRARMMAASEQFWDRCEQCGAQQICEMFLKHLSSSCGVSQPRYGWAATHGEWVGGCCAHVAIDTRCCSDFCMRSWLLLFLDLLFFVSGVAFFMVCVVFWTIYAATYLYGPARCLGPYIDSIQSEGTGNAR
jgi:hypothetical protein